MAYMSTKAIIMRTIKVTSIGARGLHGLYEYKGYYHEDHKGY